MKVERPGVLLSPPTYYEVRDVKNPFMQRGHPVDRERAQRQWEGVCARFSEVGFEPLIIPAVEDLEDMVFTGDQVFVGRSLKEGKFVVPSTMRFYSRRREIPYVLEWFRQHGYQVLDLELNHDFLEGGDLLWHLDHSVVWAGYGIRSTKVGVDRFAANMKELGIEVLPLEITDRMFFHLETCLTPLSAGAVMVYAGAFSPAAMAKIRERCTRVYEVDREDAMKFVCNGVVANGNYINGFVSHCAAEALEREEIVPAAVETSEFEKSGASVGALTKVLE